MVGQLSADLPLGLPDLLACFFISNESSLYFNLLLYFNQTKGKGRQLGVIPPP